MITDILNQIYALKQEIVRVDFQIEQIAGGLVEQKSCLEDAINNLTKRAKDKARFIPRAQRHTLRGDNLQLVYSERTKWDDAALEDLARCYNIPADKIDACKVVTGTWSIRAVGKG